MADFDALGFASLLASPQVNDPQSYLREIAANRATRLANDDTQNRQLAGQLFAQGRYADAAAALAPVDMKAAIGLQDRTSMQGSSQAANSGDIQGAGRLAAQTGNLQQVEAARGAGAQINAQQVAGLQGIAANLAKLPEAPGDATNDPNTPRAQRLRGLVQAGFGRQFGLSDDQVMKAYGGSPGDLADGHLSTVSNFSLPYTGTVKKDDTVFVNGQRVAEGVRDPIVGKPGDVLLSPQGGAPLASVAPLPVDVAPGHGLRNPQTGQPLGPTQAFEPKPITAPAGDYVGSFDPNNPTGGVSPAPASAAVAPASGNGGHNGPGGGTLGDRSNNPGNIQPPPGGAWLGQTGVNSSGYAIFDTPEHGARALDKNLAAYAMHGIATPEALVERWASTSPPNEKAAYAARIRAVAGNQFNLADPAVRAAIAPAIATSEGTHLPTGSPKGTTGAPLPGSGLTTLRAATPVQQATQYGLRGQVRPDGTFQPTPGASYDLNTAMGARRDLLNSDTYKLADGATTAANTLHNILNSSRDNSGLVSMAALDNTIRAQTGLSARANQVELLMNHLGVPNEIRGRMSEVLGKGFLTPGVIQEASGILDNYARTHNAAVQKRIDQENSFAKGNGFTGDLGIQTPQLTAPAAAKWLPGAAQSNQVAAPRGAPPVPPGQALAQARAYVAAHPQARAQVIGRLRGWGINPTGL